MRVLTVELSDRSYPIQVERGSLARAGDGDWPGELAVLTGASVAPLYAEPMVQSLRARGHRVAMVVQPDGEQHKTLEWVSRAYDALVEFGLTRRGAVIAVGGGVVGDWAGFVAATWMRGVPVVQVPTTLLAMVDSSVGGKTGVNHARAKNLIGAFHQPSRVVIDPESLRTLPPRELSSGLAEVVKYAVIADADLFLWLEEHVETVLRLDMAALEHIILASCAIKARVVGEDERESDSIGRRAILNYGHTVAHALEAVSEYGSLLHGEAVSIGMTVAARLAGDLGLLKPAEFQDLLGRQTRLLERCGLPVDVPKRLSFDRLWEAMLLDKKTRDGHINFILSPRLGAVEWAEALPRHMVEAAVQACRAL